MLLKLHDISLTIPNQQRTLFSPFSTEVQSQDIIMCVGESGQGKSSLLRIMAKLALPSAGKLSTELQSAIADITLWRQHFTYVSQQAIMQKGTIEDNLKLPFLLHKKPFDEDKAKQYIDQVGLSHLDIKQDANLCSGGEQQRIALIRAILLNPTVLLLDEVTSAIDELNSALVEQLLLNWVKEDKRAIVWISHHPDQVKRLATKVWCMANHHITIFSDVEWRKREVIANDEFVNA